MELYYQISVGTLLLVDENKNFVKTMQMKVGETEDRQTISDIMPTLWQDITSIMCIVLPGQDHNKVLMVSHDAKLVVTECMHTFSGQGNKGNR